MKCININTKRKQELIDITSEINELIKIEEGICIIFCPHTTAAITINENADDDVKKDVLMKLSKITKDKEYRHSEKNSDAHLVSSIVGCSETVIIESGKLKLGTWQSVYFLEFDGPRQREVWIETR